MSQKCIKDFDCLYYNFCNNETHICNHLQKDYFSFSNNSNLIGYFLYIIISMFGSMGSLNGGALNISNLLFIFYFYLDEAKVISFMSKLTISSISFLINCDKQHPYRKEIKAIDYNITILAMPLYMLGLIIGDFFTVYIYDKDSNTYKIIETTLITIILSVYFLRLSYAIYKNHFNQDDFNVLNEEYENGKKNNGVIENNINEYIESETYNDNQIIQWEKIRYIIVPFLVLLLYSVIINSKEINRYSPLFWILTIIFFIILIIYNFILAENINKKFNQRVSKGYPFAEKEIKYNKYLIYKLEILNLLNGLIVGMTCIDQSILIIIFLILQNCNYRIIQCSVSFYSVVTSIFSLVYFVLSKNTNYPYLIIFFVWSAIGSIFGNKISGKIIKINQLYIFIIIIMLILASILVFSFCNYLLLIK